MIERFASIGLLLQEWKEERRRKLEYERLTRQKLDANSVLSDDPSNKTASRSQSRAVDAKVPKRPPIVGQNNLKGPVARRASGSSNLEAESNMRAGSEMDIQRSSSQMTNYDFSNDFELYFTDPQQLLAIFTELEEQNLSLIQNSQDHEEQLEEITRELQITMQKKNIETESLQRQVNSLEQAIAVEEQKEKELMAKVG